MDITEFSLIFLKRTLNLKIEKQKELNYTIYSLILNLLMLLKFELFHNLSKYDLVKVNLK